MWSSPSLPTTMITPREAYKKRPLPIYSLGGESPNNLRFLSFSLWQFGHGKKVRVHKHQTDGIRVEARIPKTLTAIKCLSYTLSQPGVITTIPGVSNIDELRSVLAYPRATQEEKDYSQPLKQLF